MTVQNLEQQCTIWNTALKNEGKASFKYNADRETHVMILLENKSKKTHKSG